MIKELGSNVWFRCLVQNVLVLSELFCHIDPRQVHSMPTVGPNDVPGGSTCGAHGEIGRF